MKYLVVSLKSRNEIYAYLNFLKSNGIFSSIINTPASIGSSCMLAIKLEYTHLNKIVNLLNKQRPKSFRGLFLITNTNGNQIIRLI